MWSPPTLGVTPWPDRWCVRAAGPGVRPPHGPARQVHSCAPRDAQTAKPGVPGPFKKGVPIMTYLRLLRQVLPVAAACHLCGGSGEIRPGDPCRVCNGTGRCGR
ncbi:hypothetical protein Acsp04_60790 [Actinomadura sp. NBRC 104425]|nr:hypothetical protein Acsp04_60790 [Actinomadura sp. NBRC 104425]